MPRNFHSNLTAAIAALLSAALFVGTSIAPATQNVTSLVI